MSTFDASRGAVLATAVAAFFTAGCTLQNQGGQSPSQSGETVASQASQPSGEPMQGMPQQKGAKTRKTLDQPTEAKVACFGINACKGQSDCATPNNACKGMNSCKGQGFKYLSLRECESLGGKVITPNM